MIQLQVILQVMIKKNLAFTTLTVVIHLMVIKIFPPQVEEPSAQTILIEICM